MPLSIGKITAELELVDRLSGGIDKATRHVSAFAASTKRSFEAVQAAAVTASERLEKVGRSSRDLGNALLPVSASVAAAGFGVLKVASDFESAFAGVRKTVTGSAADLDRLSTGFRALAKEIPVSVTELSAIGEAAGQLGIETKHVLAFTRVMADLGATTNLSSQEAASQLARLANITQMPQTEFDRLGSTVVALGNQFASTEREIVDMGLRIAGAGNAVGLTEGQILGVATALSSLGLQADMGGSAISRVLIDMASAVSEGGDQLGRFASIAGISGAQFAAAFKDNAAGALDGFVTGLGRLQDSGGDVLGVLKSLGIEEILMRDTLLRAAGAGDLLTKALQSQAAAWTTNSALTEEARQRYQTFASQLTILWSKVTDIAITIGNALLPSVLALVEAGQPLLRWVEQAAQWFATLPESVRLTTLVVGGLVVVIAPLVLMFGTLAAATAAVLPVLAAAGAAITGISAPVAIAIAAIAALTAAVVGGVAAWWTWGADVTAAVSTTMQAAKTWLVDYYRDSVLASVVGLVTAIVDLWVTVQVKVLLTVAAIVNGVREWLVTKLTPVVAALAPVLAGIVTAWQSASERIVGVVRTMVDGVRVWLVDKLQTVVDGVKRKIDAITGFFRDMKRAVVGNSYVPEMIDLIAGEMQRLGPVMVAPAAAATRATSKAFETLGGAVRGVFQDLPGIIQQAFSGGGGVLQSLGTAGARMADTLQRSLMERLKGIGGRSGAAVTLGVAGATALGGAMGGSTGATIGSLAATIGGLALQTTAWGTAAALTTSGMVALGAATLGIGVAAVGVYLLAKKFFTVSKEVKQARVDVQDFQQELWKTMTPMQVAEAGGRGWAATLITVRDAYVRMGYSAGVADHLVAQLLDTSRPEEARAAMAQINTVVGAFQNILAKANEQMGGLLDTALEMGQRLPDALLDSLARLRDMGDLSAENIALLERLTKAPSIDYKKFEEAAGRYGINQDALGLGYHQSKATTTAQQMIDDVDLLSRGGASMGTILHGMREEISALVSASLQFGTTLPENMRPWIDRLAETGQLVDENGEAIKGLANLRFAESLETSFSRIADSIQKLVDLLTGPLMGAFNALPKSIGLAVDVNTPGGGQTQPHPYDDGTESTGFAGGTLSRGSWFRNFGAGTPTVLHGTEAVVRPDQTGAFVSAFGGGAAGGRGGDRPVVLKLRDGRVLAEVVAQELDGVLARRGVRR